MSKGVCLLLFLPAISFAQISVIDNTKMSQEEKSAIANYLLSHDKVTITSAKTDSALFRVINLYRMKNNLNVLKHSIRLDTLADKVIYQHLDTIEIVHYTQLPELRPYRDLMSLENLEYGRGAISIDLDKIDKYVDTEDILQGWIDSPGHNKNLLAEAHIGTTKVIMIIRNSGESDELDHLNPEQIDQGIRSKLTTHFRTKLTTLIRAN